MQGRIIPIGWKDSVFLNKFTEQKKIQRLINCLYLSTQDFTVIHEKMDIRDEIFFIQRVCQCDRFGCEFRLNEHGALK